MLLFVFFFFKQKTAYEMRISDWSSDVCSSDLSAYWEGGKGLGSEGGIECLAVNDTKGPVNPGDTVTARLRVMYNPGGGTPKGSRGQVRLQWYDSSDNLLKTSEGFLIKTRAYNGKWTDTAVSDRAEIGRASGK